MDEDTTGWAINEMRQPLSLDTLAAEILSPEVRAQVYAASLLAIEVDRDAERSDLATLAASCQLHPAIVQRIHQAMGMAVQAGPPREPTPAGRRPAQPVGRMARQAAPTPPAGPGRSARPGWRRGPEWGRRPRSGPPGPALY